MAGVWTISSERARKLAAWLDPTKSKEQQKFTSFMFDQNPKLLKGPKISGTGNVNKSGLAIEDAIELVLKVWKVIER